MSQAILKQKTKYKSMQDRVIDDIHKEEDKRIFNNLRGKNKNYIHLDDSSFGNQNE
jgi:hypothetical protein